MRDYDLILLDVMLPRLDGFEVFTKIRRGKQKELPLASRRLIRQIIYSDWRE